MIPTKVEIEKIKEILSEKNELGGWSLNRDPKNYGDCIVLVYNKEKAEIPVIVSIKEESARLIADKIAKNYSTANEVYIVNPIYDRGEITDIDIEHKLFKFTE